MNIFVFGGVGQLGQCISNVSKKRDYQSEKDLAQPINVYGKIKLEGELENSKIVDEHTSYVPACSIRSSPSTLLKQ